MLTVKHVEVTGHQNLYPATRVSFQPRMLNGQEVDDHVAGKGVSAPNVFIDTPKGDTLCLGSWGAFYIMNETGKTVQKWDLGGWFTPEMAGQIVGADRPDQYPTPDSAAIEAQHRPIAG